MSAKSFYFKDVKEAMHSGRSRKPRKTRVYVSTKGNDKEVLGAHPPFGPRGEDPVVDMLWDAWNAHWLAHARAALVKAFDKLGIDPGEVIFKATYDRKAGCSCGCSPGFVLKNDLGADFWVTMEVGDNDYYPGEEIA